MTGVMQKLLIRLLRKLHALDKDLTLKIENLNREANVTGNIIYQQLTEDIREIRFKVANIIKEIDNVDEGVKIGPGRPKEKV